MTAVAATEKNGFLKAETSPHPEKNVSGSSSRPQTGGQTLINEASKGGCLRRTGIAVLPGATARAPIEQDCDVRLQNVASNVRKPFRQSSNATLKAAFAVGEQPVTVARGNEPANHRHTTGANLYSFRLVMPAGG